MQGEFQVFCPLTNVHFNKNAKVLKDIENFAKHTQTGN